MMTDNELLSALVDGELQGKDLEQALELVKHSAQAKQQFQVYQQASDFLNGYTTQISDNQLATRISFALRDENSFNIEDKPKSSVITFPQHFWKQATSLALAASVGAIAVISMSSQQGTRPYTPSIPAEYASNTSQQTEVADRLASYLSDHNEYAGSADVFSYAQVVSYGGR